MDRQIIQSNQSAPRASSATKELDDLMASLSDFKVNTTFLDICSSIQFEPAIHYYDHISNTANMMINKC